MSFLANRNSLSATKLTNPPNFLSLLMERSSTRSCSSLARPFAASIWLLLRYSSVSPKPSNPYTSSIWFSERSNTLNALFLSSPFIAVMRLPFNFSTLNDLWRDKSAMAAIRFPLRFNVSKWRGGCLSYKIEVSWLSVALTLLRYFKPLRYLRFFKQLKETSTFSKNWNSPILYIVRSIRVVQAIVCGYR